MKMLLALVVLIVVVLIAFNYLSTGEFSLMPGGSMSDEERELNMLQGDFRAAAREYRQAGRSVAMSGVDASGAGGAALAEVDRVEKEARQLARKADDPELKAKAEELLEEIAKYKRAIQ
jgi:hypothetical protein